VQDTGPETEDLAGPDAIMLPVGRDLEDALEDVERLVVRFGVEWHAVPCRHAALEEQERAAVPLGLRLEGDGGAEVREAAALVRA
jgi:predicted transcriptional regulator